MFFYTKGDALYRCHRDTGNIDFVGNVPGLVNYEPITNYRLAWWKISDVQPSQEDLLPEERGPVYSAYVIDTQENTMEATEMGSWNTSLQQENTISLHSDLNELATIDSINSVSLPLSSYPAGSYFTTTGTACNHSGGVYRCKTYSGAKQCAGFARYVYAQLFGGPDNGTLVYTSQSISTGDAAKKFIQSLEPGTRIRLYYNSHSIILSNYYSTSVRVYDCNWSNNRCEVSYQTLTYEGFANKYKTVSNYLAP